MIIKKPEPQPTALPALITEVPTGTFCYVRVRRDLQYGDYKAGDTTYGVVLLWMGSYKYFGTSDGTMLPVSDLELIEALPNSFVQVVE